MVQIRERTEELLRAAVLVANHEAALARSLDLERLDHRTVAVFDVPQNALVDLERVLARFLEEDGV